MKRCLIAVLLALSGALLGGCATTIRSEVTAFHDWPSDLRDKTYVFERSSAQNNNLEYLSYEKLVRAQLNRLGFDEATPSHDPTLRVALDYGISVRDVHEVYPVVVGSYWPGPWYGPGYGYYRPYGPFYDPFWYGPPLVERREVDYQLYTRRLHITMTRISSGKTVYETTVVSKGTNGSLPAVMPYMIRSAFVDFPGKSGVPHYVELKMQ
jgi:hypothetical protein